jgi:hypothetical protein
MLIFQEMESTLRKLIIELEMIIWKLIKILWLSLTLEEFTVYSHYYIILVIIKLLDK